MLDFCPLKPKSVNTLLLFKNALPVSKGSPRSTPNLQKWSPGQGICHFLIRVFEPVRRGTSTAERSYPASEVRGIGQECQAATAQERPRGATLRPRSGASAESARLRQHRSSWEELPHVQGAVAVQAQEGLEELFHVQGQEGRWWEIPLVKGKEQRLHFAGAAMKRYPTSKVRETQVRW